MNDGPLIDDILFKRLSFTSAQTYDIVYFAISTSATEDGIGVFTIVVLYFDR